MINSGKIRFTQIITTYWFSDTDYEMLVRLPRSTVKRTLLLLKVILVSFVVLLLLSNRIVVEDGHFDVDPSRDIIVVDLGEDVNLKNAGNGVADFMYIDNEEQRKPQLIVHQLAGRELKSIDTLVLQPWASSTRSLKDEAYRFLNYINNIQVKCSDILDIGKEAFQTATRNSSWPWKLCYDVTMTQQQQQQGRWEDLQCLVYSFGTKNIGRAFEFELSKLGCDVHSFNPSLKVTDVALETGNTNIQTHRMSLDWKDATMKGLRDGSWRTRRLIGILNDLGHRQVDILRADLASSEWKVLENIVTDGTVQRVHQLLIKIYVHWSGFEVTGNDSDIVRYWYSNLKQLENNGFLLYAVTKDDKSPQRFLGQRRFNASCCYTLCWVNMHWNSGFRTN
ncbi:putative methyltransferase-like protein 24 [Glandiceps talaboti]